MLSRTQGTCISQLNGYSYPKLHKGKKWYVDFYANEPVTNEMKRKKYFIDMDLSVADRYKRAAEIITTLSKKLFEGWNPWVEVLETRGYTLFTDVLERYLEYVERKDRKKTRESYRSRAKILLDYIKTRTQNPIKFAYQFDSSFCNDFLDWVYLDRENGPRTYNNYRGWLFGFAEFLIARKHIKSNPVEHIKVMREEQKFRKDLTPMMLKELSEHLYHTDKPYLLACFMQYYTLIRPNELSHLRIQDFSVAKQTVFVSGAFSKNRRDAEVGLNADILKLMLDLNVFNYPDQYYLFGTNFLPCETKSDPDIFNKRWKKVREELQWSECYQFYSLKDSGIRDLANEKGVVVARDQARHSDITTTNKYIQQHGVQQVTLSFEGNMSYDRLTEKEGNTTNT